MHTTYHWQNPGGWEMKSQTNHWGSDRLAIKSTREGTCVNKRTARVTTHVATQHSSPTPHFDQGCDSTRVKSNYIPHILYIVVYEPSQRASFSIPVKRVSFKSFDYRHHRACTIARPVSQLEHINFIPKYSFVSIVDELELVVHSGRVHTIRGLDYVFSSAIT